MWNHVHVFVCKLLLILHGIWECQIILLQKIALLSIINIMWPAAFLLNIFCWIINDKILGLEHVETSRFSFSEKESLYFKPNNWEKYACMSFCLCKGKKACILCLCAGKGVSRQWDMQAHRRANVCPGTQGEQEVSQGGSVPWWVAMVTCILAYT